MIRIKMHGIGGQGVVSAAKLLSHAVSIHEDRYAKTIPAFGHERRGAPVFADVMIDSQPVLINSFVYEPDIVVLFSTSVENQKVPIGQGLRDKSIALVNCNHASYAKEMKRRYCFNQAFWLDADDIAQKEFGHNIPNIVMLGALCKLGLVKSESISKSLSDYFKHGSITQNNNALTIAYENTQEC